jgi:hypothetical protein
VDTVDHETYQRETSISMALNGVKRAVDAGEVEDTRKALTGGLYAIREDADPPDRWIDALKEGRDFPWEASELGG